MHNKRIGRDDVLKIEVCQEHYNKQAYTDKFSGREPPHLPHGDLTQVETVKLVVSEVATEVIVAVTEVLVDETEALQEGRTDLHLLADENSHRKERTVMTDDAATEIETTMSADGREVLSTANEIGKEKEMTDETIVIVETSATNVTNEPMAMIAKVWKNSMSKWKKYPADPSSAPESPVPAHDELDTAE